MSVRAALAEEQAATDNALAEHPDLGERLGKDGIGVRECWSTGSRNTPGMLGTPTCCVNASMAASVSDQPSLSLRLL